MANRTTTAECRKFTPNIFNKSKCSHCFKQREEHSAAALESNRASRKVSKCGYLFVAPDWDFNNPLYRTKRWQRRWFVLYDDGELTYSVDEHPETVPQAIVDMTKVLEVTTAEDVTGHTNSIAITAPERVTFVKGTCPEESKWWLNVLVAFPKSKGRHKRNATFPGGMAANNSSTNSRNRHNSYHKDSMISPTIESSWNNVDVDDGSGSNDGDDVTPNGQDENNINAGNEINNRVTLLIEDLHREEKLKDLANSLTNNRWSTPIPDDEKPTRDEPDYHVPSSQSVVSMRPKSLPLASNSTPAIVSAIVKKIPPVQNTSTEINNKTSPSRLQQHLRKLQKLHHERGDPDGGCNLDDLSTNYLSPNSELRVCLPAEDVLNSKKGWLMKQEIRSGEWSKHWFSLRGAALFFYRDPVSEERGVLDGVLDVNSLTSVCEINSSRNYAFQLTTWDKRRIILSGLSANSRTSWIAVLKNASGLQQQAQPQLPVDDGKKKEATETEIIIKDNTSDDIKREIEKDFIKAQRNQSITPDTNINIKSTNTTPVVTPITPKSIMFSSDEEYRTASEGGRRDSVDWGSPLSPSPPVPLSLFRSKEKSRPRTGSSPRLHKRSRSSPPSSRRSTVDSVGSEDMPLIHPVQEEINDKDLELRLGLAEKERDLLKSEAREREARMSELLTTLEKTEHELTSKVREMELARDKFSNELEAANRNADKIINRMTYELDDSHKKIKSLEDRLARGIEENEGLYKKLREYEGCNPSGFNNLLSRTKIKRMDSLSDLTNITDIDPYCLDRNVLADEYNELKSRFEKAVNEIKAMKKELKDSQNEYDSLEISYASLKQDFERKQCNDKSQLKMMAERIQDLTLKYSGSERQVRTLKQKLAKSERRRSLSLKSKDQLTVSKEFEIKVNDLEAKIEEIEKSNALKRSSTDSKIACKKPCNLRRKSLEGSASTNSVHLMVRLNDLEKRFDNVHNTTPDPEVMSTTSSLSSSPNVSEHMIDRLRSLENVLVSTKDRIEQNLQQLQALRSSRTRRSVSPISDRKDSFKMIEKSLVEVVKVLRESCDQCVVENTLPESNPIKIALVQLESQLRNKLSNLLNQRRVLRDRNELTQNKDLGLIAERVAFESVCFGVLKDSLMRDQLYSGNTEVIETSHQITQLKARLSGKCSVLKSIDSLEVLSKILTKRLMQSSYKNNKNVINEIHRPVDPNLLENIIRQQNEINLIIKRYKNNTLEKLASGLAAETLSYISSNDLVQGAVQEAWRQAQEAVNAELIQSEISHIMLKNAERLENSMKPSCYLLTCDDRITFEAFADAVQEALRKEMGRAIEELTHCYDDALERLKRSRHLHFDQNRKPSEGRILLTEFADIIAHKALVDARIAVLSGERASFSKLSNMQKNKFSVTSLQKYENMFDDLANDLNLSNPGDILAEADFEFLYKNHLVDFVNDKSSIIEITSSLSKLESSLVKLNNAIEPANNKLNNLPVMRIETLQDVCLKCRQLRDHMENLCNGQLQQQQKFNNNNNNNNNSNRICENCNIMKTNLSVLQAQHDSTVKKLQQDYTKDIMALRQQLDCNLKSMKNLENERNTLLEEISHQTNVVEIRERELTAITDKLKSKEHECHLKDKDYESVVEKLGEREGLVKDLEEKSRLCDQKYLKQDEEYIVLLQERDYVQTELNKERDKTRKLEKRLEMLELEHTKQLECLQEAYREQILSHCSDFSNIEEEESFRQRYQSEIEQLRTLCEKGLAAMESSHRRIISDLEEKHRKEIERLLVEKEQALAEETQATLAALDAMRKAHQSEVQREVARFKQDFIRQFQKGGEQFEDHSDNNEEELEELRQEILSFSEKYSIKCVENAALEEKLRSANQKLKNFQQMQQLELRNRQFRAHLASEDPSADVNFVQGLASKDEQTCADSEHVCDENDTSSPSPKSPMEFDYQQLRLPKSINEGLRKKYHQSSSNTTENQQNHHQQQNQKPKTITSKLLSNNKATPTKLAISLDSFTNLLNSNTDDDVLMITKQIYSNAMQHQHHNHKHTSHNHNHNHNVSSSSPSSLGGRDVEPQPHLNATTSHLRRFELEI